MNRDDLSDNLVHLTRGETDEAAADAFLSILGSTSLSGSSRDIRGGYKCVCFSEAPLPKLAHILSVPEHSGVRYKPFGVMTSKHWLFQKGGRPVIYQPENEFPLLPDELRYRHVRYEPGHVDHSWEREWRIRSESLTLDPAFVTLVVPSREWGRWLIARHAHSQRPLSIALHGLAPPSIFSWHFVALEDMGVQIPSSPPPAH